MGLTDDFHLPRGTTTPTLTSSKIRDLELLGRHDLIDAAHKLAHDLLTPKLEQFDLKDMPRRGKPLRALSARRAYMARYLENACTTPVFV